VKRAVPAKNTVSLPPLRTTVSTADPPAEMRSRPWLSTTVPLAVPPLSVSTPSRNALLTMAPLIEPETVTPPLRTFMLPPVAIVSPLTTPPDETVMAALATRVPLSVPLTSVPSTVALPPALMNAPLSKPPASICSEPPVETTVALAVPPDRTSRIFPVVMVRPELVTPEATKVVVIGGPSRSNLPHCACARLQSS
jgi:hypothetical protein